MNTPKDMTPKIDLHCHLEGAASPALVRRLARRNDIALPEHLFDDQGQFAWTNFVDFLKAYDMASSAIRTAQDYRDVMYEHLKSSAAQGCVYVEVFSSPDHAAATGLGYTDHLEGIIRGIDDGYADFGIIGRIIVTCVRHLGPKGANAVADAVVGEPHPFVVGFGMGGDENQFPLSEFSQAFGRVSQAGLPTTVHAGEVKGPQSVIDALDALPVSRIGHGVRAVEDPGLVRRIINMGITLEICTGSNLALGLYGVDDHPLKQLLEAGCKITLGSDDPPYFATTIGGEYRRAREVFGLSDKDIARINQTAVQAAFCDVETKTKLQSLL